MGAVSISFVRMGPAIMEEIVVFILNKQNYLNGLKGSAATLLVSMAMTSTALAQEQEQEAADEIEQIIVTGSRLGISPTEAVAPVQIIGADDIDISGATNIQELLLENPAFGTPALSRTNSAFLTSGTGVATVDLRDLGSDRTLVLINGRRVVSGLPGSSIVDLNMIPSQFVERVDILTGGASSLYGSDAISGVVNFIYKDDFEGVEAGVQYGLTDHWDDKTFQADLTMGGNFDDDRGNIMVHLGYTDQTGVLSSQRENTQVDDFSLFRFTGDPADFGVESEPFFSSGPPQGRFDVAGTGGSGDDFTYDANGVLRPCFSTNGGIAPDTCGAFAGQEIGPDGFNRQAFRTLAVPVERYLFAARGHYDLTENVTVFMEGTYSSTSSSRQIEPFFFSSEDVYPDSGGRVPIETDIGGVLFVNPIVPDEIVAASTDTDGDGLRDIGFIRRIVEFGPRQGGTSRDTYRFVVGLNGTVMEDRFNWDLSYNYGTTKENQFSTGQPNVVSFREAFKGVLDVNDEDNDGQTDDVVCADPTAREQGCIPVNIFGVNSITEEALGYLEAGQSFQTNINQYVVNGNINGDLFELPGGAVAAAAGFEYRKETSVEELDALTNAGLNAGNALPDTSGEFDVIEGYFEARVPLLSDLPMAEILAVGGAVRVADYSTVGTVTSWNINAEWAPIEDIRFRATYAESVRAPNVGELFTGPSQTFPPGLSDPCEGVMASGGGTLGDVCRASAGVLDNIANNGGVFTLTQPDTQGISGFNSGNPDLGEEKSESITIGAVITPTSIEALSGFTFTIDYFDIKVEDAITQPPRQFILDQCYNFNVTEFCDLITRRPTSTAVNSAGSIEFVDAQLFNSGGLQVEGIDVTATYSTDVDFLGSFSGALDAKISYTHLFEGYSIPVPGAERDPFAGEIGTADNKFTSNLRYTVDDLRLNLTGTYIGKSAEDDQFLAAFDLEPNDITVGAEFYLDLNVNYTLTENVDVYVGVDNVLGNDAPAILSGTSFNITGHDTAADVYNDLGRKLYAGARFRF